VNIGTYVRVIPRAYHRNTRYIDIDPLPFYIKGRRTLPFTKKLDARV
jgi:hypothetical protein